MVSCSLESVSWSLSSTKQPARGEEINVTITPHLPLLAWAFPDSSSIAYHGELWQMYFCTFPLLSSRSLSPSQAQCCPHQAGERGDGGEGEVHLPRGFLNYWKWGSGSRSYQCLNISHLKEVFFLSTKRNESLSSGISYLVSPSTESKLQHRT